MERQNAEVSVPNFGGGRCTAKGTSTLAQNELVAANNIILRPNGNGFRSREGNSELNSTALASGAAITGLGYLRTNPGVEYLVATAGTQIFSDQTIDGSFTDITGGLTITAGQNNFWTMFQADGKLIGVGGGPDAPWKYTGTGTAALLGGSPPSGRYGFQYGNRTFIMNTTTDPSSIFWTVLLNSEDWSGDGSGNAEVEPNDGDSLITAAPINLNTVILFKRNSIYLMTGRESPFPIFPLFQNIGCVGVHACVVEKGLAYFITSDASMAITDGNQIIRVAHLPDMDDVWKSFRQFRLPFIQGHVVNGADFDWIVWSATKSAANTNDYAAIWDVRNECWLTGETGFEANAYTVTIDKVSYMGGYDGKVYRLFAPDTHTDDSVGGTAVPWEVESDWIVIEKLLSVKQINRVNILHQSRNTGTMTYSYGYDYVDALTNKSFPLAPAGAALWDVAQWDIAVWDGYVGRIVNIFNLGRGNAFKWKLSGASAVDYDVSMLTLFGKHKSQRVFDAVA